MKKILVVFVVLAVSLGGLFANGRGDLTTIEGKLTIHESLPAVETKEGVWLLPPGPFYRIAWENDISRGDTLMVRGFTDKDGRFAPEEFAGRIMPVEVRVNGKDLDIDANSRFGRPGFGPGGYGPGDCESFGGRRSRQGGWNGEGPGDNDGSRNRRRNR
jgi:hypothetical protein